MENVKQMLLEEIEYFHEIATDDSVDFKERSSAHKLEMEATDRLMKLEEAERASKEAADKALFEQQKQEKALEEQKRTNTWKWVEVVCVPVGILLLDHLCKQTYMRHVCEFEKDYTFTTTAGKGISSLFRWKK